MDFQWYPFRLMITTCLVVISVTLYSQAGRVGINTSSPQAVLHVMDSSVVFTGPLALPGSAGNPAVSGAGHRTMWYANKAAFRTGGVDGNQWNKDSTGTYSFASGFNVKAKGFRAAAFGENTSSSGTNSFSSGENTKASGLNAVVFGFGSQASGSGSTALGNSTTSSGNYALAGGFLTRAVGLYSTAFGNNNTAAGTASFVCGQNNYASGYHTLAAGFETKAKAYASFVTGRFNDTSSLSSILWNPADPLFVIGNGNSDEDRNNALTVLKSGNTGINMATPGAMLHVVKNTPSGGPFHASSTMIIESNENSYIQFSNSPGFESGLLGGGSTTAIRNGLIFKPDSSVHIRTGGNISNVIVDKTGKVGIGNVAPGFPINLTSTTGDKISLFGNSGNHYGFGIQDFLLQIHTAGSSGDIAFGYGSSASFTETMRIKGNGKVGIGTNAPAETLHVRRGISGAASNANTVGLFENNVNAYLSILTSGAHESGLLFGNPGSSAHGGIIYNSMATPNGLQFRTNLNATRMVINNQGLVGIGITEPLTAFHVWNGDSDATPVPLSTTIFESETDTYVSLLAPADDASGIAFCHGDTAGRVTFNSTLVENGFGFYTGSPNVGILRFTITYGGNVGIGTSTPDETLHVSGNGKFSGMVTASCGVLSCSDIRYKKNITPLSDVLSRIQGLQGIYYDWDLEKFSDITFNDRRQIGVIAQELEQQFPELVHTDKSGYKTIDYSRLTPVLLEAIKELADQVGGQQKMLSDQKNHIDIQQTQINFLLKEMEEIQAIVAHITR